MRCDYCKAQFEGHRFVIPDLDDVNVLCSFGPFCSEWCADRWAKKHNQEAEDKFFRVDIGVDLAGPESDCSGFFLPPELVEDAINFSKLLRGEKTMKYLCKTTLRNKSGDNAFMARGVYENQSKGGEVLHFTGDDGAAYTVSPDGPLGWFHAFELVKVEWPKTVTLGLPGVGVEMRSGADGIDFVSRATDCDRHIMTLTHKNVVIADKFITDWLEAKESEGA